MQEIFHHEPTKTFLDKATKIVAWFMGSWWGVLAHTAWFIGWVISGSDIDNLTLWVSLEAIFIGIFLLMASNKAEEERDRRERLEATKQMTEVQTDVSLDKKQLEDLAEIKTELKKVQKNLAQIKPKRQSK